MKKNNVFWGMLGLSTALHGLVLIGATGNGFPTPSPVSENHVVSTLKIIEVATAPRRDAPGNPQEKKTIEKSIEPVPEPVPVEKTDHREEARENGETVTNNEEAQEDGNGAGNDEEYQEYRGIAGNNGEAREGGGGVSGDTNREYDALLAYIKDFIDKNLAYPPMARRRNIQGVVTVHFEIESNGGLAAIMVDHSSGNSILDNAAVSLVKKMGPIKNIAIRRKLALNVNIDYRLTE
ncbi:MAG: TonB family protein [Treponema sp.]|jgi:TonB family protein|nr:TonB family protein [Treponema sp.]